MEKSKEVKEVMDLEKEVQKLLQNGTASEHLRLSEKYGYNPTRLKFQEVCRQIISNLVCQNPAIEGNGLVKYYFDFCGAKWKDISYPSLNCLQFMDYLLADTFIGTYCSVKIVYLTEAPHAPHILPDMNEIAELHKSLPWKPTEAIQIFFEGYTYPIYITLNSDIHS